LLRFAGSVRIAFLTFEYPDIRPGGVGSYVLKCAAALAAAGHEAHIFTLSLPPFSRDNLRPGIHLHEVGDVAERVAFASLPAILGAVALNATQAAYKLAVGVLLCDALRREHQARPFDLVEAAECDALALPLLFQPAGNLPLVVQIHLGSAVNAMGNAVAPQDRDDLAEALELACIVGADAVCAATASVVEVSRKLSPFQREVTIIPYPVDVASGLPPALPDDGAALFVGRLQRRKGCDVLAAAADIFLRRNPRATLRIAGGDTRLGPGGSSMVGDMISRVDPSLRDRLIYLGELSQVDLRREILACRFQVVPSTIENFANTAVDAMALGRLVIYAGNTGLDEVVGDSGLRVWPLTPENLAETMETAWNDRALVQTYGLRGYKRVVEKFNPAKVTADRVDFYDRVITEHRAANMPRRQWNALSATHIRAVLEALVRQISGPLGLDCGIPTPGRLLTAHLKDLAQRLKRPPSVWLFGAGRYTLRLLGEKHLWESAGFSVAGIVDEHPRFQQKPSYLGLAVQSPQELCSAIQRGQRVDAIILSTDTLQEVLSRRAQCFRDLGIEVLSLASPSSGA
jgi:glycosyltransferase involved in cell wall biosynthesis